MPSISNLLERYPVLFFFIIAYALTWGALALLLAPGADVILRSAPLRLPSPPSS